nr:transmembrane protein 45B [Ipomoea batatas]
MGTLVGHLVPGLALAFLGLMHTINTIRAYYQNGPAKFRSRFWYPIKKNHLLYLELILVLSFSVFAMVTQLISFPPLQFSLELLNLEHATMFLHLAIFAGFTLFAELNHSTEILTGISGILASSVFSQELFLLHYHSTDHVGLEGHYHWLLQIIVCISLMAALFATTFPAVFPAALVLSVSVVFQGCWFVNMGFVLWVPRFVARGCMGQHSDASAHHSAVVCGSHEAGVRAVALANLQFSWILAVILALVGAVCLVFARNRAGRGGFPNYEQLHSRVVDDPDALSGLKQVQHVCPNEYPTFPVWSFGKFSFNGFLESSFEAKENKTDGNPNQNKPGDDSRNPENLRNGTASRRESSAASPSAP